MKRDRYVENLESKFIRKEGSIIIGLISASIIEIEGESHLLSVVRDITERKNIEDELRKSQLMFSQLFYQSSTSMCLYNAHGTFVRANLEFCRMFGVEEEAVVGIKYNIFEDQTSTDGLILYKEKLFNGKKSARWQLVYDMDVVADFLGITTVKGGKIEFEVFGYPILDDQNNLQYVVLQHYDIGECNQTEADLKANKEK